MDLSLRRKRIGVVYATNISLQCSVFLERLKQFVNRVPPIHPKVLPGDGESSGNGDTWMGMIGWNDLLDLTPVVKWY